MHVIACERDGSVYRGRITYDHAIMFNIMDHVYASRIIGRSNNAGHAITFTEHLMHP